MPVRISIRPPIVLGTSFKRLLSLGTKFIGCSFTTMEFITPYVTQGPRWSALQAEHGIDLVVCVSSAQRRGLLEQSVARKVGAYEAALADGFRIAGLGLLMEAIIDADRHICFGN